MKICNKCKIEKDSSEFGIYNNRKDGLQYYCKECTKEYDKKRYKNNKEKLLKQGKEWYKNNKEHIAKNSKKRYKNNKEQAGEKHKQYQTGKANYDTYALQISYAEKVINVDGFLQVKCTYCGKWYFPTVLEIQNRIRALNNIGDGNRLYCSEECKEAYPIFNKKKFQVGHPKKNENLSREVQPELREMVLERDKYTCIRCGKHQDELDAALHCHHIEGIQHNPIESADIDICVTVCRDCHWEIHQEEGCRYVDLQCKKAA